MDIGTAKPSPAEQAEVPHHRLDLVDPDDDFTVAEFQRGGRRRSTTSTAAAAGRCWSAAPACTCGRSSTASTSRAVARGPRRARGRAATPAAAARAARRARPGRRRRGWSRQPPPGRAGARGDARQRPAVLLVRARARQPTRRRDVVQIGPALAAPGARRAHRAALRRDARRRPARRGRARWPRARRPLPHRRARRSGYKELLDHLDGQRSLGRGDRAGRHRAPASSPCARSGGSGATPAYAGSTSTRRPGRRRARRSSCEHCADDRPHADQAPRPRQRLPRRCSTPAAADDLPALARRLCDRRRGIGADGLLVGDDRRRATTPTSTMVLLQRRRQPGRDERQRHPLPRPGAGRSARRPRRPATCSRHRRRRAPRRRSVRDRRPRHDRGQRSTWARSAASTRRPAGADVGSRSAPARSRTSASATRTPSSASTTSACVDLLALGRQVPHVNLEIVEPGPEPRRHHDARARARRRHHRGLRHRRLRRGLGRRAVGSGRRRRRRNHRAHGRRRCEGTARPARDRARSP